MRYPARMHTVANFIHNCTRHSGYRNQANQNKNRIQIRKEVLNLSVFADDIMIYIENPKEFTKSSKKQQTNTTK